MNQQVGMPTPPKPIKLSNKIKNHCDVWKFWSHKAGDRVVTCYSAWEFENAKRLEASRDVVCWREQPLRVKRARAGGKDYILDYWAYLADKSEEYGEVKCKEDLVKSDDDEALPKDWPKVVPVIESMGATARVVTDVELKTDAFLLANWERAIGHIARAYYCDDAVLRHDIGSLVERRPPITLGELEGHFVRSYRCDVWAQTLRLYQEGRLSTPLDTEPLDRCLRFRPRER